MKEVILLKDGEIALKGLNRSQFESVMMKNIKRKLAKLSGEYRCVHSQSATLIEGLSDDCDMDEAADAVSHVFGINRYTRAAACEKDIEQIKRTAAEYLEDDLESVKTFKVEAKRSDKSFPLKSPEICDEVGGYLLSKFHNLKVDVHNPDNTVFVEVRDNYAFVHSKQLPGAGGLPTGTSAKGMVLISGGIDSPVASYMMAKRGMTLNAVHFASPPYTSVRAERKVYDLLHKVALYSGEIKLFVVPFTKIQEKIRDDSPEELFTVTMRRIMMKIACELADKTGCLALITGESVGQVASQTVQAIQCTDDASSLPVFRPLIGMDKSEITDISRKIDTYDISIEPYADCCTVFTPKHPRTKPTLTLARNAEKDAWSDELIKEAIENVKEVIIK